MIESPLGATGIPQFGMSVDPQSAQLAVLKGNVEFKDANQKIKNVITTQEIVGTEEGVSDVKTLPETKKNELASAVADSKKVASQYDLTRLSNIVDGYGYKPLHCKVCFRHGTHQVALLGAKEMMPIQ